MITFLIRDTGSFKVDSERSGLAGGTIRDVLNFEWVEVGEVLQLLKDIIDFIFEGGQVVFYQL